MRLQEIVRPVHMIVTLATIQDVSAVQSLISESLTVTIQDVPQWMDTLRVM